MTEHRKLVYVPEINSKTFLYFFSKGETGRSYCLRDYSGNGSPSETYARSYPYTDDQILAKARYCFEAPVLSTKEISSWHKIIEDANWRYLKHQLTDAPVVSTIPTPVQEVSNTSHPQPAFPILDLEDLLAHPIKGAKTQDLERILTSPTSEDYVTWNMIRLLQSSDPRRWWPQMLDLARKENPSVSFRYDEADLPRLDAWQKYLAPKNYEGLSRERMARSYNPSLIARSKNPKPVEGETEVDLVVRGRKYLIFAEAKLESDVSMTTTYDPHRNQIIRNIDVLLENCEDRAPFFWMLVKDIGSGRAYKQLTDLYRNEPGALAAELPHRDPDLMSIIAKRIALIKWCDLLYLLPDDDSSVIRELRRRVG